MGDPESWERVKRLLEAALFASGDALSEDKLRKITGLSEPAIEKAVSEINEELREHPFYVEKVGNGWMLVLRREYEEKVAYLFPQKLLSKSEIRTLALVAANEPVSLSEVVRMRGSRAKDHLRRLIQLGLVRELRDGRKRVYRTTKKFSLLFRLEEDVVRRDPGDGGRRTEAEKPTDFGLGNTG